MGIRGLQTFIDERCPDVLRHVSIQQLADSHRNRFHCSPVIVVDGFSLISHFCLGGFQGIYDWQLQYVKVLENVILKFQTIGVKLVFFFDGSVRTNKRAEWVRRRVNKYYLTVDYFRQVLVQSLSRMSGFLVAPTGSNIQAIFVAQELGVEVHQTDREADGVIAEYALNHPEVFAILSQDSDFVIYNTKPYLSLKELDLDTMRTVLYDRDCFSAQYLNLYVEQLPLFACLMGNDFVPLDKLKSFHLLLSDTGRVHFNLIWKNLCRMIRTKRWMGNFQDGEELNAISQIVFGDTNMADLIQEGLKSYQLDGNFARFPFCIEMTPGMEKEVYDRHLKCVNAPFVYNLLCTLEYDSVQEIEYASRKPASLIYREIRQRCYGVLFNSFMIPGPGMQPIPTESGSNIVVNEWCAYVGNPMHQPEKIIPLPLDWSSFFLNGGQISRLEDVWFKYSTREKMLLFWSILQIPMKFETLMSIPEHLKVLACLLSYLIGGLKSGSLMQPLDVAVFVAVPLVLAKKSAEDIELLLEDPPLDIVAINLCTLFLHGVMNILMVIDTCGSPFDKKHAMPWRFFDGKLFHSLYNAMKYNPSVQKLCENQRVAIKGFYSLLQAVTRNTEYDPVRFNWKTIFSDFQL